MCYPNPLLLVDLVFTPQPHRSHWWPGLPPRFSQLWRTSPGLIRFGKHPGTHLYARQATFPRPISTTVSHAEHSPMFRPATRLNLLSQLAVAWMCGHAWTQAL